MSRLDSLGLLLKDIYPCKLVLFFPSFADIKPPFNLQAGFDIRCIHLFNILCTNPMWNKDTSPRPVFNKPENNSPKPISLYNLWINFQFYTRFHHRLTRKFSW